MLRLGFEWKYMEMDKDYQSVLPIAIIGTLVVFRPFLAQMYERIDIRGLVLDPA